MKYPHLDPEINDSIESNNKHQYMDGLAKLLASVALIFLSLASMIAAIKF